MFVRHVMTREVFVLDRHLTCRRAYAEFRSRGIRRAPVVDHARLVGIVTLHDLLHALPGTVGEEQTDAGQAAGGRAVEAIMHHPVFTVHPNDHLEAAAHLMLEKKVGGLPVVRDQEIVGIITESDIFRALWGVMSSRDGSRLIVEESAGTPEIDYGMLLAQHGSRLESLLRFPVPAGGSAVFVRAAGGDLYAVVKALWAAGARVQEVGRE